MARTSRKSRQSNLRKTSESASHNGNGHVPIRPKNGKSQQIPSDVVEPFINGNAIDDDEDEGDGVSEASSETGSASAIDDPVRMYLMQMGNIPLLTREEEITAAKRIEATRTCYRHSLLANDFVLQGAVTALEKVQSGALRLDRTIDVSVTNTAEKRKIMKRIGPNLDTLRYLLSQNHVDYRTAIGKSQPADQRHAAWKRLVRRRNKAVRLIEEMNLRIQRLQPMVDKLLEISSAHAESGRPDSRSGSGCKLPCAPGSTPCRAALSHADYVRKQCYAFATYCAHGQISNGI